MLNRLKLYYHTLKPLRFEQIWYRLRYRLFPLKQLLNNSNEPVDIKKWSFDSFPFVTQSLWGNGRVQFLNEAATISVANDWNSPNFDKLWLYNLHYFDDLNSLDSDSRVVLQKQFIKQWLEQNPPMSGNGWEPYPISLRLVNWVKWCQRHQEFDQRVLKSIRDQSEALLQQLEFHILGNHLFANAKALAFVGCFLEGSRADGYLTKGLELLDREVPEQFLSDGGHFELSPMYHCILLWDMLDLYQLLLVTGNKQLEQRQDQWRNVIVNGLAWLKSMCHPDGQISFFNDGAFGIAPPPYAIFEYASRLDIEDTSRLVKGAHRLSASGYSRLSSGHVVVLFDHAEVGPSYLPGHAHSDTLSFELSVGAQRLFVNSGTSVYGSGDERARQRSTQAHNTVVVNEQNSSEVWGGFRVARRANILDVVPESRGDTCSVTACHDGFSRFQKGLTHKRTCSLGQTEFQVVDELSQEVRSAEAYFHLHPDIAVEAKSSQVALLTLPSGQQLEFVTDSSLIIESSTWHPEFGKSIPSHRLVVPFSSRKLSCNLNFGSNL
ncbi:heparinase II/III family protein [Pseudidiomarina terrestris]|uniref:heparinase II/III family protein n=1 Tax=Pseudidiomarina terrestris TaxID=2820060 RepID=UPI00265288B1|nr:alginate lyase family protein [Pseudidiomarina sp. 1ASP75-5]MDN7134546.1 alginate lyase family protein [Pseudidiomarina sp. 1ASP75-5]